MTTDDEATTDDDAMTLDDDEDCEPDQKKAPSASTQLSYAEATAQTLPTPSDATETVEKEKHPIEAKRLKHVEPTLINIEDDSMPIRLSFEVLLSPEMSLPDSRLVICFGPPLSDWETECVEMRPKSDIGGGYILMVGVYDFPKSLIGKTIPYKYVAVGKDVAEWEHIFYSSGDGSPVNRCLVVPEVESHFTKFDDVVLGRKASDMTKGRHMATFWMLPGLKEFSNPNFSLSTVIERFEKVLEAHGNIRVCIKDSRSVVYSPKGYNVRKQAEIYMERCMDRLKEGMDDKDCDMGHILRAATYICLIRKSQLMAQKFSVEHYQLLFRAFHGCSLAVCNDASLPVSMDGEIQTRACMALKQLVTDFVDRERHRDDDSGNWIYVVPFIHRWDQPNRNDGDWLKLDNWKKNIHFRYLVHVVRYFKNR